MEVLKISRLIPLFEVIQDFGNSEEPHDHGHHADPVHEGNISKGKAKVPGNEIGPD